MHFLSRAGATTNLWSVPSFSSSAVCDGLIGLVQPFGRQAMDGWQTGALLRRIEQIVSGTSPLSVCGLLRESPANGIKVQVVDGGQHRGGFSMSRTPFHADHPTAKRHCGTSRAPTGGWSWHPPRHHSPFRHRPQGLVSSGRRATTNASTSRAVARAARACSNDGGGPKKG